jgi:radical SAM-linked protein
MPGTGVFRYRIEFAKTEAMRFTGHLDLHRTWERTFRRARLPLAYTQGFSPHPRLAIAAALPLGCVSEQDLIDVWLEEALDVLTVESRLREAAPPGIRIANASSVHPAEPNLPGQVMASEYLATSPEFPTPEEMGQRVNSILSASSLPRTRRGKTYDLRPLVEELRFDTQPPGLRMRLSAREGASGRPDEVLEAMGFDPGTALAIRTRLILASAPTSIA